MYPHSNAGGIKKALYYFGGRQANDAESKALYAFRNGLMHDCSFVSHDKRDSNVHYWFRFCESIADYVQVATVPWDGNPSSRADNNLTLVSPTKLRLLVEIMIREMNDLFHRGELQVTLAGGTAAIANNYLLRRPRRNGAAGIDADDTF